jgi:hypothetical protein
VWPSVKRALGFKRLRLHWKSGYLSEARMGEDMGSEWDSV